MLNGGTLDLIKLYLTALIHVSNQIIFTFTILDFFVELVVDDSCLLFAVDFANTTLVNLATDHIYYIVLIESLWDGQEHKISILFKTCTQILINIDEELVRTKELTMGGFTCTARVSLVLEEHKAHVGLTLLLFLVILL